MRKIYLLHFIVALLAFTILRIWWQGKLALYVHPSTEWFVALGGGAILLVSFLWTVTGKTHFHITTSQTVGACSIVLLLTVSRNVSLSASLAKQRQTGDSIPQMSRSTIKIGGVTSNFSILEWLAAWETDPTHRKYLGSPVKLIGFIVEDGGNVAVARMLLTCCAVDAQPIFLRITPVENMPAEGQWVEIEGEMDQLEGKPFIQTKKLTSIEEPANPYVY
jgi:uncharacterized repeat protein (TIGR03943 family)